VNAIVGFAGVSVNVYVYPGDGKELPTVTDRRGYYKVNQIPIGSGLVQAIPVPPTGRRYINCKGLGPIPYSGLTPTNTDTVNFMIHSCVLI